MTQRHLSPSVWSTFGLRPAARTLLRDSISSGDLDALLHIHVCETQHEGAELEAQTEGHQR